MYLFVYVSIPSWSLWHYHCVKYIGYWLWHRSCVYIIILVICWMFACFRLKSSLVYHLLSLVTILVVSFSIFQYHLSLEIGKEHIILHLGIIPYIFFHPFECGQGSLLSFWVRACPTWLTIRSEGLVVRGFPLTYSIL